MKEQRKQWLPHSDGGERVAAAAAPRGGCGPEGMWASENQTSHMRKPEKGLGVERNTERDVDVFLCLPNMGPCSWDTSSSKIHWCLLISRRALALR